MLESTTFEKPILGSNRKHSEHQSVNILNMSTPVNPLYNTSLHNQLRPQLELSNMMSLILILISKKLAHCNAGTEARREDSTLSEPENPRS